MLCVWIKAPLRAGPLTGRADDATSKLRLIPFPKEVESRSGTFSLSGPLALQTSSASQTILHSLLKAELRRTGHDQMQLRSDDGTQSVFRLVHLTLWEEAAWLARRKAETWLYLAIAKRYKSHGFQRKSSSKKKEFWSSMEKHKVPVVPLVSRNVQRYGESRANGATTVPSQWPSPAQAGVGFRRSVVEPPCGRGSGACAGPDSR